ncbi:putative glucan endo-1,3-beta-glucosidase BG4 [Silene latifolia]|uniref:putative glucan endo-1,3-beta-glucosidase BG4 n=1 Tax=Silene latifolia TaxID=37657 RepID=UPI003D77D2D5
MANYNAMLLLSLILSTSIMVLGQSNGDIGVCYGLIGDNLPRPKEIVSLYQKLGIKKMRIFQPYPEVLEALRGSGIQLVLGTLNQDIPFIASGEDAAREWFMSRVQPYVNDIDILYISVGNEVIPGEFSESILPAMENLQKVLDSNNLGTKATTVVHAILLGTSFPPSEGKFSDKSGPFITEILKFLSSQKTPLLVNLYPYFPYAENPTEIPLDYALLSSTDTFVQDGPLSYTNLLDAMLDAFYWAVEKEGVNDVNIVISESGWPHGGNGDLTTSELASIYNSNFVKRVESGNGTPKRPQAKIEGYIFALLDENLKEPGVERNWGLFTPTLQPNYVLF